MARAVRQQSEEMRFSRLTSAKKPGADGPYSDGVGSLESLKREVRTVESIRTDLRSEKKPMVKARRLVRRKMERQKKALCGRAR